MAAQRIAQRGGPHDAEFFKCYKVYLNETLNQILGKTSVDNESSASSNGTDLTLHRLASNLSSNARRWCPKSKSNSEKSTKRNKLLLLGKISENGPCPSPLNNYIKAETESETPNHSFDLTPQGYNNSNGTQGALARFPAGETLWRCAIEFLLLKMPLAHSFLRLTAA